MTKKTSTMKKYISIHIALLLLFLTWSCKQEVLVPKKVIVIDTTTHSKGSADFTKFVAIGSSYTAGFQAGALFNAGQANSLPAIMAKQFAVPGVNGGAFNQPDINSALGYNIFISPNPGADGHVLGRMLLQGADPVPTPQPFALGDLSAVPNPGLNPGFIYAGSKATLNNFAVEAITLGQYLISNTGNWAVPNPALGFSPFYARFASNPGTSKIIGDAAGAGGSFFMFWGGMDDFLLYAAFGGDPTKAPLTDAGTFAFLYNAALSPTTGLLASNPNLKGVVANFPDIFAMPHFTAVPWNALVFAEGDLNTIINPTNAAYAPYNGGLDAVFALSGITAAERDKRKIHFAVGANGMVIEDETLTNLSGFGLPSIRQATESDKFPLAAGSVIGTEATPGDPSTTWGVGKALTDQYALIPSEIAGINAARAAFNQTIKDYATANSSRLAFADVDAAFTTFVSSQVLVMNGVTIWPKIDPPAGIYSEDGLHPNSRGYAYISTIFIDAINKKYKARIPLTDISLYGATALPIP